MIELNEAFASQALACIRMLGLDEAKVNVRGGAIAARGGSSTPQLWRAWIAVSNARPKRRVVSGSNRSPSRYSLIGIE